MKKPFSSLDTFTLVALCSIECYRIECEPAWSIQIPPDMIIIVNLLVSPDLKFLALHYFANPRVPVILCRYWDPIAVLGITT